jgi:phosphotransferase system enzyme I (PtsI)
VTIRTFDLDQEGGGMRGVRLSLLKPDTFRRQLRALLRASSHGALRIMFPFVSAVEELREARRVIREAASEIGFSDADLRRVPVGAMIEVPAAAYTADLIAREADFLTIGTNDLIQYCLAVDRSDARVSQLYAPLHPAILRMVVMVRRAARRRRIPVSLCGEMASDPVVLALLVGLGLTEFSMTPAAIPLARRLLQEMRSDDLRAIARRALRLSTIEEIEQELERNIVVGQRG